MSSYTQSTYTQMVRETALSMKYDSYVRIYRDQETNHFLVNVFCQDRDIEDPIKDKFYDNYDEAKSYANDMENVYSTIETELTSTSDNEEDYDVCVDCGTYSGTSCSCEEPRDVYLSQSDYFKMKLLEGPRSKYESAKDYQYRMECIDNMKQ